MSIIIRATANKNITLLMKSFSDKSQLKKVNFTFPVIQSTRLSIRENKSIVKLKMNKMTESILGSIAVRRAKADWFYSTYTPDKPGPQYIKKSKQFHQQVTLNLAMKNNPENKK